MATTGIAELDKSNTGGGTVGGMLNQSFATGGTRVLIDSLSPETAEYNEEQREAIRELCAASGGYYAAGTCHTGQAAIDVATRQANSETASQEIIDRANKFLEENTAKPTEETTDNSTGKDPSAISDEEAISAVLASLPDKLKGIFNEQNIMKVLEAVIDDPMTKIKKDMGAGVEIIFDEGTTWEDWKVFGPLAIPGIPLPPGIIDVTLGDIADAAESVGGSISEIVNGILTKPDETIKKIGTEILSTVRGVFEGTKDDPGFGGTLGTFKDWVLTTMGGGLGGLIFTTISNEASTIFGGNAGTTPPIPGGTTTDEEPTPTPKQGDDIVDLGGSSTAVERPPPDDIFVDTTDDPDTDELLFGGRNQTDVVGGTRDLTFVDGGDDDDRRKTEIGGSGGGGGGDTRTVVDNTKDPFIPDPEPPKPIVIGGGYVDPQTPEPIEIGGPIPPPVSSGGGGSVGGGTGTSDPFVRAIQYTPTVPVAIQQQAPVDYASGLMSPNTSMDAIGQLIFRNLA